MIQAIKLLSKCRDDGHQPETIINASIANGWQGLFEPQQPARPQQAKAHSVADSFADKDYGLDVPELYFDIIKEIDPLSRQHLVVKNPQRKGDNTDFAAFARLDLGKAAYYLPVLSASAPQLEVFDAIYKDGMKPEDWLEPYLEQANKV